MATAEERIIAATPHLREYCHECKGYTRQSGVQNDEPVCANCQIGFAIADLDIEDAVFPEEYR